MLIGRREGALLIAALVGFGLASHVLAEGLASGRCVTCHERQSPSRSSHPIDISILGKVVADGRGLPLVNSGVMTCMTCHEGHKSTNDTTGNAFNKAPFSLRAAPPELCARCHRGDDGTWDKPHAFYATAIHGGSPIGVEPQASAAGATAEPQAAEACIRCHEKGEGGEGAPKPSGSIHGSASHPMVDYAMAVGGHPGMLVPVDQLPPEIRLDGGKVSCVSCHNLFAGTRWLLPTGNVRKQLCLACHDFSGGQVAAR